MNLPNSPSGRQTIILHKIRCAALIQQELSNLPSLEALDDIELERFRFTALRVSGGNLDQLKEAIELAKADWRDLLLQAKFWTLNSHKSSFPGDSPYIVYRNWPTVESRGICSFD